MKPIWEEMRAGRVLFDGSMGALLSARGVRAACPDILNLEQPDTIRAIHREYKDAGARVIITDTFGSSPAKLRRHRLDRRCEEIVAAAVQNARAAAQGDAWIALDVGPTGEMLAPLGNLPLEDAVSGYARQIRAGEGADFALIETMTDIAEARSAMRAAREAGMPFAASFTFEASGRTMTGGAPECAAALAQRLGAFAVGINCSGGPEHLRGPMRAMLGACSLPVIIQPNAGLPEVRGGETVYPFGPEEFVQRMRPLLEDGAAAVGGCCGTTPEHIRLLSALAAQYPAAESREEPQACVCSQRRLAPLDEALAGRMETSDPDDLYDLEDEPLAVLDLRGQGAEDAQEIVEEAQLSVQTPLGFRAEEPAVLEAALREYAGIAAVFAPEECAHMCAQFGAYLIRE